MRCIATPPATTTRPIGSLAPWSNTIGIHNTADGQGALFSNTSGNNNTACGQNALRGNTTGRNNIAVGYLSGQNLITGSNNIDIGNAGVNTDVGTIRIGTAGTPNRPESYGNCIREIEPIRASRQDTKPLAISKSGEQKAAARLSVTADC
jgi:hypothetical protein